jgi:hypothetical protein
MTPSRPRQVAALATSWTRARGGASTSWSLARRRIKVLSRNGIQASTEASRNGGSACKDLVSLFPSLPYGEGVVLRDPGP